MTTMNAAGGQLDSQINLRRVLGGTTNPPNSSNAVFLTGGMLVGSIFWIIDDDEYQNA